MKVINTYIVSVAFRPQCLYETEAGQWYITTASISSSYGVEIRPIEASTAKCLMETTQLQQAINGH